MLAAVHGPRQAQPRKEDAERAVVEVVFRPRGGLPGSQLAATPASLSSLSFPAAAKAPLCPHLHLLPGHREREFEQIIRGTLEGIIPLGMHPRTSIMVVLQVRS